MGRKILCGRFAERLKNNFAVGDEDNNLILYNLVTPKPITVLNAQTNNLSSLTALTFTQSDEQIVAGSTRGTMSVWDLSTLKSKILAYSSQLQLKGPHSRSMLFICGPQAVKLDCEWLIRYECKSMGFTI